jgi:hypothetical protein
MSAVKFKILVIKSSRVRWARHVIHMREARNTLVWKPEKKKMRHGSPRSRREIGVTLGLKETVCETAD